MKKILEVLKGKPQSPPPVWFMRQAGRYLPGYQEIRKNYNFLEMIKNPELIAKITLEPVELFDLDGAILFSDILVVLPPLGFEIIYKEGFGFEIIKEKKEVEIKIKDPEKDLNFVFKGIEEIRKNLSPFKALMVFQVALLLFFLICWKEKQGRTFMLQKNFYMKSQSCFLKI